MPPKSSFTRGMLLDAAFKIVRGKGRDGLSARSLASELNCSTMPVYSYLKSMKKLDTELRQKAIDLMITYQTTPRTGQPFLDMGLGYVMFAKHEKNLFRFLFAGGDGERKTRQHGESAERFRLQKPDPENEGRPGAIRPGRIRAGKRAEQDVDIRARPCLSHQQQCLCSRR